MFHLYFEVTLVVFPADKPVALRTGGIHPLEGFKPRAMVVLLAVTDYIRGILHPQHLLLIGNVYYYYTSNLLLFEFVDE
jgi:hypothetical protein